MSTVESRSPQDPEDVILRAEEATAADVREAVQRGRNAQATWSRVPAPAGSEALAEAAQSLDRAADELTDLVIREVGKPRGLRRMDPAASSDALVCRASPRCSVQASTLSWRGTTSLDPRWRDRRGPWHTAACPLGLPSCSGSSFYEQASR